MCKGSVGRGLSSRGGITVYSQEHAFFVSQKVWPVRTTPATFLSVVAGAAQVEQRGNLTGTCPRMSLSVRSGWNRKSRLGYLAFPAAIVTHGAGNDEHCCTKKPKDRSARRERRTGLVQV